MQYNSHIQYVLCKETTDKQRYCYTLDSEWFSHMYNRHFKKLFEYDESLEDFLNEYKPEYEGSIIYMVAKQQNRILEEEWIY